VRQALRDLAALVARVAVGGLFFANGWTKLQLGLIATGESFARQGAPAPGSWATVTMLAELIGGALLVAGLAVPVAGLALFFEALAVFLVARPINPVSANELVALGAAAVLLAVVGAGRISVDHLVVIRRREAEAASDFAADTEADQVIASLRASDPAVVRAGTADTPRSGAGTSALTRVPASASDSPGAAQDVSDALRPGPETDGESPPSPRTPAG
jgi:putative oxidoreductase